MMKTNNLINIKKDKYLQKRGGSSKILDIFCQNCSKKLFIYQKDGIGQLKRCYFNRIMTDNIQLENNEFYCPQCKEKIGFGIIHTDKRVAIKLLRGKIKKKKYKESNNNLSVKIMNILIATQNQDKFQIIKGLLSRCGFSDCLFKNLSDVKIKSQSKEYGSLINRALMKAQHAYNIIDQNEQIDIFVGVDDGMKCKNNKTDENSKEITEKILCQNFLSIGEIMIIVRAFAFLNKEGKTIDKFETEIPFKFIGNANNIQLQDMKYPLSYVLTTIEKKGVKSIVQMSEEESMNYYLFFSKKRINKAMNKIIN